MNQSEIVDYLQNQHDPFAERVKALARNLCEGEGHDPDQMVISNLGHRPRWMSYLEAANNVEGLVESSHPYP